MALFDTLRDIGSGIRGIPDNLRDRRRRRLQAQQTGIAAPEIGRDFEGTTGRLEGLAGGAAGAYGQDRAAMGDAMGMYRDAALGGGPSVAENLLAAQSDRNVAAMQSAIAGGRGGNMAAMSAQGAAAGAAAQMGTQQQAAALRAEEIARARDGYGMMAGQMAGMSSGRQMGFEAGLGQAYGQQLEADLAQRGLNVDQRSRGRQDAAGLMESGGKVVENIGAAGQAGMFSDERVKTDVAPGGVAASQAMAETDPVTFQYKGPEYGQGGQQIGILAQDLEKTPAGQQIVQNTPAGKQVDVQGGVSLALASGADQEQRLRQIEQYMLEMQNGGMYETLGNPIAGAYVPGSRTRTPINDWNSSSGIAMAEPAGVPTPYPNSGKALRYGIGVGA